MEFMKKVEEISKKVGDTASNTYNTVADKSGKLIEETKQRLNSNTNYDMSIDNLLFKIWEEFNENNSRS